MAGTIRSAEIAEFAGVGRPSIGKWRARHADFPQPIETTDDGWDVWDRDEVLGWLWRWNEKRLKQSETRLAAAVEAATKAEAMLKEARALRERFPTE